MRQCRYLCSYRLGSDRCCIYRLGLRVHGRPPLIRYSKERYCYNLLNPPRNLYIPSLGRLHEKTLELLAGQ